MTLIRAMWDQYTHLAHETHAINNGVVELERKHIVSIESEMAETLAKSQGVLTILV